MTPNPFFQAPRIGNRPTPLLVLGLLIASITGPGVFPTVRADEPGLIAWWDFSAHRQQGTSIKAAFGGPNISPSGPYRMVKENQPPRIELPGRTEDLVIAQDLSKALLPKMEMTAEAWVRVDQPQRWGGILGVIQDNGDYERGWILGYNQDRFSIGVSTEGRPRLVYLDASWTFEMGRWHHVVGTYDGETLRLFVDGRPAGESTGPSGPILYAPSGPFVAGAYRDDDEHYRMRGAIHEIRLFQRALTPEEISRRYRQRRDLFPEPAPEPNRMEIAWGPFVDWIDRTTVRVHWETDLPMPTRLEWFAPDRDGSAFYGDDTVATRHEVVVGNLKTDVEHHYVLHGPAPKSSEEPPTLSLRYLFDTSFHYAPARPPAQADAVSAEAPHYAAHVHALLQHTPVRQGYAWILGAVHGRLALELVRQTDLKVVVVDRDPERIQAVRRLLDRAGIYGVRASAHQVDADTLPFGELLANLIVSETTLETGEPPAWSAAEIAHLIRPSGGTLLLGGGGEGFEAKASRPAWQRWARQADMDGNTWTDAQGTWLLHVREALAGAGDWSHQYGSPNNAGTSMDEWVRGDLRVAWWGDPGPRPMPDRGNRNPAPLSVNGRLYIQGDRVLFGLDAYNGSILWSTSSPEMRRANVPRDSSNMVADADGLYVAQGRWTLFHEGQSGERTRRHQVPGTDDDPTAIGALWGYLAVTDGLLLGSRVEKASTYLGDDGEWYEDFHPEQVSRVTSDLFFAMHPKTGEVLWKYQNGRILNSTITIGDDQVFFIESRNPVLSQPESGRLPIDSLTDTWLVALDLKTGRRLWHKAEDFSACEFMTYLVHSDNTLVVTGTDRKKHFHTFAFHAPSARSTTGAGDDIGAAEGGRLLWQESHKEDKGHHSGHLQHPLIIDGVFYSDQRAFGLRNGELIRNDLPDRRGCGVMSASRHAIFYRAHFHGMWDLESDKRSQFEGIRGGCWLGLIPAGGMLLAPESSAGCSCTHAIQTSVGYLPTTLVRK